jgi:hypothetical protein
MSNINDTVYFGGSVKYLGDNKVGGFLVRYGSPDDRDVHKDFFHEDTDYGEHKTTPVYYMHGLDRTLKGRILAKGATLEQRDVGIWIEAQLRIRDAYEKYILEQVKLGKMGWSSGTPIPAGIKMGSGYRIDTWHLGIDASILPSPAETRNTVVSVKSLLEYPGIATIVDTPETKDTVTQVTIDNIKLRARAYLLLAEETR